MWSSRELTFQEVFLSGRRIWQESLASLSVVAAKRLLRGWLQNVPAKSSARPAGVCPPLCPSSPTLKTN